MRCAFLSVVCEVGEGEADGGGGGFEACIWLQWARWYMQMIDDFTAGLDNSSKQI